MVLFDEGLFVAHGQKRAVYTRLKAGLNHDQEQDYGHAVLQEQDRT